MKTTLFASALFVSSIAAQTAPCLSANDQSSSVSNAIYTYAPAGPWMHAWQITPATTSVAESLRIYTGNNFLSSVGDYMSLEIWDDASGLPGTRQAGGTWLANGAVSWQGTNLDLPVVLQANVPYWIVFIEPGWSTPPTEPGGSVSLPSVNGINAAWGATGTAALKYRIYCNPLDDAGVVPFGPACASGGGTLGTAFTNQPATLGNADFAIEGTGFPPGMPVLHVIGTVPGFPSVPIPGTAGCFQNTNLEFTAAGLSGVGDVRAVTASGHTRFPFPIPANPALAGFYFASQLAGFDPAATGPLPFVSSNALQITL